MKANFPYLGFGLGLRRPHYHHILEYQPPVDWFEIISENFMGTETGNGGPSINILEQIRSIYPIVMHGVSLSIGSADGLNDLYLKRLKELIERIEPEWVSDHLCWTGIDGENLHDLLPLPYTEDTISHVVEKVTAVQEFLDRQILLENVSSYLSYQHSEMSEWEFLTEIANRADCGILLDINNIYVSSVNHQFDPIDYLTGIPKNRVRQFHLAGYSQQKGYLLDTHDHPITPPVWELYEQAIPLFGLVSTNIERDDHIPEFEELFSELQQLKQIQASVLNHAPPHP